MDRNRKAVISTPRRARRGSKSQPISDEQYAERLRIAKQLVQALREAGYSCECEEVDDGQAGAVAWAAIFLKQQNVGSGI